MIGDDGVVHVIERAVTTYGVGIIGLCEEAQRHKNRPWSPTFVPTCFECIAREARVRHQY